MSNIKLKDGSGTETTYSDVSKISVPDATSGNQIFIQPSGNIEITNTNSVDVSDYATAQVVDSNLVSGNIKKNVQILGVTGSFEGGGGSGDRPTYCISEGDQITGMHFNGTLSTSYVDALLPTLPYSSGQVTILSTDMDASGNSMGLGCADLTSLQSGLYVMTILIYQANVPTYIVIYATDDFDLSAYGFGTGVHGWNNLDVDLSSYTFGPIYFIASQPAALAAMVDRVVLQEKIAFGDYVSPSGTLNISANGTYDVKNYSSAVVSTSGYSRETASAINFSAEGGGTKTIGADVDLPHGSTVHEIYAAEHVVLAYEGSCFCMVSEVSDLSMLTKTSESSTTDRWSYAHTRSLSTLTQFVSVSLIVFYS